MKDLLGLLLNLSLPLHWAWLGEHIVADKPLAVRVLCRKWCPLDALLPIFVSREIPWSIHYNSGSLPPKVLSEAILIMSDSIKFSLQLRDNIALVKDTSPSKYVLIVQNNDVLDTEIQNIFDSAFKEAYVVNLLVVPLQDRVIFAAYQKCGEPQVITVPSLTLPGFRILDVKNCSMSVMSSNLNSLDFAQVKGELREDVFFWFQLLRYIQRGLHFRPIYELGGGPPKKNSMGTVYTSFAAEKYAKDISHHPSLFFADVVWCVPDSCTLRDTTYLIWEEFPQSVWLGIATSVVVVSSLVYLVAVPQLSFSGCTIMIIGTVASVGVRLPGGHARWPLAGWLLSTIVIGTLYQAKLHSMMTAPDCDKLQDESQLLKSKLSRFLSSEAFPALEGSSHETLPGPPRIFLGIGRFVNSVQEVDVSKGTDAVLTSSLHCDFLKRKGRMRELPGHKTPKLLHGWRMSHTTRPLRRAFRKLGLYAEAAGLIELWQRPSEAQKKWLNLKDDAAKPIDLNQLKPAYILLFGGSALTAIVFVGEVLWHRFDASGGIPLIVVCALLCFSAVALLR